MIILITKNGQQMGPYTLEAARALVLAGTVTAKDWAWVEGAADWVPLHAIPGFANAVPSAHPSPSAIPKPIPVASGSPVSFVSAAQEKEMWKGTPSQLLNLSLYIKWVFVFTGVFVARGTVNSDPAFLRDVPKDLPGFDIVVAVLFLICAVQCIWCVIKLRATHYTVTNQRVRVDRGLLSKDVQEIELFRVKDTSAHQTLFLRLFGLGNVRIVSGDATNPLIFLRAIPRAMELREKLRQEVFVLRQKFGVRELDIMQGN